MTWFFIALVAPFLWAIVNHTDKYLLSKYFKEGGIGALMIFSTLSSLAVFPIAFYFSLDLFHPKFIGIAVLVLAGLLYSISILFYLIALKNEEATVVVPFFQLVPVFGYFLGYFLLGEDLAFIQIIAGMMIIVGAIILSLNLEGTSSGRFKFKTGILMTLSSLVMALYGVLFKLIAVDSGFWASTFWENIGVLIFGLILFSCFAVYRGEFLKLLQSYSIRILSLNITSEVFTLIGNLITAYAILLAPVVLVFLVGSYQPIFVLLIGVFLTLVFPKIIRENLAPRFLAQKIIAIIIIFAGSFLLG